MSSKNLNLFEGHMVRELHVRNHQQCHALPFGFLTGGGFDLANARKSSCRWSTKQPKMRWTLMEACSILRLLQAGQATSMSNQPAKSWVWYGSKTCVKSLTARVRSDMPRNLCSSQIEPVLDLDSRAIHKTTSYSISIHIRPFSKEVVCTDVMMLTYRDFNVL